MLKSSIFISLLVLYYFLFFYIFRFFLHFLGPELEASTHSDPNRHEDWHRNLKPQADTPRAHLNVLVEDTIAPLDMLWHSLIISASQGNLLNHVPI